MKPVIYWSMIALLGTIHLQMLILGVSLDAPLYITILLALGLTYLIHRKVLLPISSLGLKWNSLLFIMQVFLVLLYIFIDSSFSNLIPFILFIGIEAIRLIGAHRIGSYQNERKDFEAQQEQFNETFRVVRSERHDFLKHISALDFMLENKKHEEAREYLSKLVDGYEETNLSIKGERGVVAGILHQMYRRAKTAGIEVIYDLDLPLSTLPLPDKDIVTLIGNLLSNSIEACEEWQHKYEKKAELTLQFYKRSGLYILICKNNSLLIPSAILDELYKSSGQTTKGSEHEGLGTKLIKDVVNEYQGFLDFVHKDEEFTVKIKVPAIR